MKYIDAILNKITMYLLLVCGLGGIALSSIFLSAFGVLHFDPLFMVLSLLVLGSSVYGFEALLSIVFDRPMNRESWLITTLILFLIIPPAQSSDEFLLVILAGLLAGSSKFLLAWRSKHIFNPAAFAATVLSLTALWPASWWIGSGTLWVASLLFGLIVIRKTQHVSMVTLFAAVTIGIQAIQFLFDDQLSIQNMQSALIASPLIFLATMMLTDPATMPARKPHQYIFATIAGALSAIGISVGSFHIYPEVALLIANMYAFSVSPKFFIPMQLKRMEEISDNVVNFIFQPKKPLSFSAGQYMEWTLQGVPLDARGNRRMFTIASSPYESEVMLGVKFYPQSSAYKSHLRQMNTGDAIYASQLAGSFTMPRNRSKKLAFIAGGIGITPFRSMIKTMLDEHDLRDVILVYAVSNEQEFAYLDVFREANVRGMAMHLVMTNPADNQFSGIVYAPLDDETLHKLIPDIQARTVLVSGPNMMVDDVKHSLRKLGVGHRAIKTDHFSGY